jgi:hypothetical protein
LGLPRISQTTQRGGKISGLVRLLIRHEPAEFVID